MHRGSGLLCVRSQVPLAVYCMVAGVKKEGGESGHGWDACTSCGAMRVGVMYSEIGQDKGGLEYFSETV